NEVVNEVAPFSTGENGFGEFVGVRNGDGSDVNAAEIPGGDCAFAEADDFGLAVVADLRNSFVCGRVFGPAGDVFGVAIAEVGDDIKLLHGIGIENNVRWEKFDADNAWIVGFRAGSAGSNPAG